MKYILAVITLAISALNSVSAQDLFSGTWMNDNESTLELALTGDIISGNFESGVGDGGQTLVVPVQGRILGDIITFNALYPTYGTVITWAGQHTVENGSNVIKTHWLHQTNYADDQEAAALWFSNRIGNDTFVQQ